MQKDLPKTASQECWNSFFRFFEQSYAKHFPEDVEPKQAVVAVNAKQATPRKAA